MQIYLNCSYKGSPVGFLPGRIEEDVFTGEKVSLKMEAVNIPFWIKNAFESGKVQRMSGKLPFNEHDYVVLRKKINRVKNDFYMNFLIITDKNGFGRILTLENESDDSCLNLYRSIIDIICIQPQDKDFGYLINKDKLTYLEKMIENGKTENNLDYSLFIKSGARNTDELIDLLNIPDDYELIPTQNAKEYIVKTIDYSQSASTDENNGRFPRVSIINKPLEAIRKSTVIERIEIFIGSEFNENELRGKILVAKRKKNKSGDKERFFIYLEDQKVGKIEKKNHLYDENVDLLELKIISQKKFQLKQHSKYQSFSAEIIKKEIKE